MTTKQDAIEMYESSNSSLRELSRILELPPSTLHRWIKESQNETGSSGWTGTAESINLKYKKRTNWRDLLMILGILILPFVMMAIISFFITGGKRKKVRLFLT